MLNAHSYYSLRYGTLSPEQLAEAAQAGGWTSMALTDIHRVSGAFAWSQACAARGLRPVFGMEFRRGHQLMYVCLAKNQAGFAAINAFASSQTMLQAEDWPLRPPLGPDVWIIYPFAQRDRLGALAPHERLGVQYKDLPLLWNASDTASLVWCHPMVFMDQKGYSMHRLLRAIDENCLLSKLPKQAHEGPEAKLFSRAELQTICASYPYLLDQAQELLDACSFDFQPTLPKNKQCFSASRKDDLELLKKLTWEGAQQRYPKAKRDVIQRIEKELKVIHDLAFDAYFLITWDIIRYARSRGYFHVGRGSGANSIVAYCLGITDVDPIALDLYFERFINPHRSSPPDFDIDFSWDERDEIIDYVFKRYGSEHVCLLATYVTFRDRSIYRELAKVFGLPKEEVDRWLEPEKAIRTVEDTQYHRLIKKYGDALLDFPNYLGIHAGGILIAEHSLHEVTALEMQPKGFPIAQFDMYVAEDLGFAKFDVLSQRGLGHIKMAVDIIRQQRQLSVDIHRVQDFMQDPALAVQLAKHETMGCFYIESPAMRQLIKKLACRDYLTLVAASSIIRPGVASSGMMKAYIERHHAPNAYTPVHPYMGELLAETYGVMVYQEDVIKVAHYFAGLSLAEADVLRRGMSGKYRSRQEFEKIRARFFENCQAKGYAPAIAAEVWRQMESFSGYSFSKAHSASFAVESYQSLYLKTYFPLEFMTAVINNFGGFYRTEFYVHEARRWGARIEAPEINESEYLTRLDGSTLYLGWVHVKGLEKHWIQLWMQAKSEGAFRSFQDFIHRVPLGLEQALILIRLGAFRRLGKSKRSLLWEAHAHFCGLKVVPQALEMFEPEAEVDLPPLDGDDPLEDAYDHWDLLGFPLCSPFDLLESLPAVQMDAHLALEQGSILGYLVTLKPTRTKQGERMYFGYFMDAYGEFFDTVHFPRDLKNYQFQGSGVYWMSGPVMEEFGHRSLRVLSLRKLPWKSRLG